MWGRRGRKDRDEARKAKQVVAPPDYYSDTRSCCEKYVPWFERVRTRAFWSGAAQTESGAASAQVQHGHEHGNLQHSVPGAIRSTELREGSAAYVSSMAQGTLYCTKDLHLYNNFVTWLPSLTYKCTSAGKFHRKHESGINAHGARQCPSPSCCTSGSQCPRSG